MSKDCETRINGSNHRPTRGGLRANPKNALSVVYNGFEEMRLRFTKSCVPFVRTTLARIADGRQPDRPHRSTHRFSQKPVGKWKPPKPS